MVTQPEVETIGRCSPRKPGKFCTLVSTRRLRELLDAIRMNTGLNLVLGGSRQIAEIALACGYDSASRFASASGNRHPKRARRASHLHIQSEKRFAV